MKTFIVVDQADLAVLGAFAKTRFRNALTQFSTLWAWSGSGRDAASVSQRNGKAAIGRPLSGKVPSSGKPLLELRGRVAQLQAQNKKISKRNRYLLVGLIVGVLLLSLILGALYQQGVRSYALLDDVTIEQDPANQGRFDISFRVLTPGKVYYRRSSGKIETELVDSFYSPERISRTWSWDYEPGSDIEVFLQYRGGLWRGSKSQIFHTSKRADIVILMDTTGSMGRYINMLKEKCLTFSQRLKEKDIDHRFALIGFGDTQEGEWLDSYSFTTDVEQFKKHVSGVKRFDGGDFPESSLDALEEALKLPFSEGSIRRFYLVSDDTYHNPTQTGAKVADIAAQLRQKKVLLNVFTMAEFFPDYEKLRADSSLRLEMEGAGNVRVKEIESFGNVLSEGRILED